MDNQSQLQTRGQGGTKRGTAIRRSGRITAQRLVHTARDMLTTENLERFTMRAVADRAGVGLANLQYYFPTRKDLARALYLDVGERYEAAYAACLASAPEEPLARLTAVLRWNMEDISQRSTQRFFIQLWALLGSLDDFEGDYIRELYAIDIGQLSAHIRALRPELSAIEIRQRATLIAALTEGLLLLIRDTDNDTGRRQALLEACVQAALAIATDTDPTNPAQESA